MISIRRFARILLNIYDVDSNKNTVWINSSISILNGILLYGDKLNQSNYEIIKEMTSLSSDKLLNILKKVEGAEDAVIYLSTSKAQSENYLSNLRNNLSDYFKIMKN